jgi:hypothetical protein
MTLTQLDYIFIAVLATLMLLLVGLIIYRKRPGKLKPQKYHGKWQDIQKLCADKEKWPEVLLEADALLGRALKKRKYKGKSFGERLVSAQRDLSDNDGVWFGHKLAKKVAEDKTTKLKKNDVKDALLGIRRALKDLGALK